MAALVYLAITPDGLPLESSLVAADVDGDTFPIDSSKVFIVANGDTTPITVTVTAPVTSTICGSFGSLPVDALEIVVADGETGMFTIPLGYGADGVFSLTYDSITSVTVGGFALAVNG